MGETGSRQECLALITTKAQMIRPAVYVSRWRRAQAMANFVDIARGFAKQPGEVPLRQFLRCKRIPQE